MMYLTNQNRIPYAHSRLITSLICNNQSIVSGDAGGNIKIWNYTGECVHSFTLKDTSTITSLVYIPNGLLISTITGLWFIDEHFNEALVSTNFYKSIDNHKSGWHVVAGGTNKLLTLFDRRKISSSILYLVDDEIESVKCSFDNEFIVFQCYKGTIYKFANGKCELIAISQNIDGFAISPDSKIIVVYKGGNFTFYDAKSLELIYELEDNLVDSYISICFSNDGKNIITAYNKRGKVKIHQINSFDNLEIDYKDFIGKTAISPNDWYLVSAVWRDLIIEEVKT